MKVFVAGASGAIGRRLVPQLAAGGYEVAAMTRSPEKARGLDELGAEPVVADGLDRASLMRAIVRAEPEVVIHEMTGLVGVTSLKKLDDELAATNRLRTEGTDYLLEAARAAGARRVIAQSYGLWSYGGGDEHLKTEEDPLDPNPPATKSRTLAAIRHVESAVSGADGIDGLVLRYGFFYGPGTGIADTGPLVDLVRNRKWPIVGDGAGVWSFVHIDDAAAATVAAIERGAPGVYNVADDEPARIAVWLPELAKVLGAKPPRHVPEWVGRVAAGESGVYLSTRIRGLANAKAKRELGWRLRYETWRDGFRRGLGDEVNPGVQGEAA
jgi:nucleoside-diphosphate-sugar epimerase